MNFNCLLLSADKKTINDMFKLSSRHDMSLMRTDGVVEFLQDYACVNPELVVVDYDSFDDTELIDMMLEMSIKSLKGLLIFTKSDKEILGYKKISRLEELENEIIIRKVLLLNSNLLILSDENMIKLKTIISDYLVDFGYLPKYHGFAYLKECIFINLTNCIVDKNLSKGIFPLIAKKFFTSVYAVERAVRTVIVSRNKDSKRVYPYNLQPSIKEIVNYISEMIYNDLPLELKLNG